MTRTIVFPTQSDGRIQKDILPIKKYYCIYFIVNLITSIILIIFHLFFAHKNMNVYAGNHRSKHKN